MMRPIILLLALLGAALAARADVILGPVFRDGCVLQRDRPLRIFGQAAPGEKVSVSFRGETVAAALAPTGHWLAILPPAPASDQPAELVVQGRNTVTVRDVLVGDVWLCSGQSNMEMRVMQSARAEEEMAAAQHPLIRHFKLPRTVAEQPTRGVDGEWVTCSPATVGEFSAVAYYFARTVQAEVRVPIGLINSSWGGTQIESWMSEPALRADPAYAEIQRRWQERLDGFPAAQAEYEQKLAAWTEASREAKAKGQPYTRRKPTRPEGAGSRWQPAGIYNAMIAPLVPTSIRGIIWYQGESNAERFTEYRSLFPAMIRQWRADFAQGDLPFYFVQLANLERPRDATGEQWAWQREAQTEALKLPATGMAVTIDIGEADDIHPKNKQEVGRRLALLALNRSYGLARADEGPTVASVTREGAALRVTFRTAGELVARDPALPGFEIAGADGVYHAATARLDGTSVVLTAPAAPEPTSVRYAWHNNPSVSLFDTHGLPAAPFLTPPEIVIAAQ